MSADPNTQMTVVGPLLTVAIPTFNRNQKLCLALEAMLPELTSACRLLIIDNASPVPITDTSAEILSKYQYLDIQIFRNAHNIGGNANIMRCFEFSTTKYIWVVGDDDLILPGSIATILKTIEGHPEASFINFKSGLAKNRATEWTTRGRREFLSSVDSFSNLLFLSAGIYSLKNIREQMKWGYHYIYSTGPHLAMLLFALQKDEECFFSNQEIIRHQAAEYADHWPLIIMSLGIMILTDMQIPWLEKKLLGQLIERGRIPLVYLLPQLAMLSVREKDFRGSFYVFQQLRRRSWPFDSYWKRFYYYACNLLLLFPWLVLFLRNMRSRALNTVQASSEPQTYDRV